jgi:hypothetical protein
MQEIKKVTIKVPQAYLDFMNQIFEIEKKSTYLKEENSIQRNLNKMKGILEEEFEGYGTFSAIKGNNGNVFVSIKTLEDTIVQEYPVGSLDDVYLQMRKAYYAFLRQNNK